MDDRSRAIGGGGEEGDDRPGRKLLAGGDVTD